MLILLLLKKGQRSTKPCFSKMKLLLQVHLPPAPLNRSSHLLQSSVQELPNPPITSWATLERREDSLLRIITLYPSDLFHEDDSYSNEQNKMKVRLNIDQFLPQKVST